MPLHFFMINQFIYCFKHFLVHRLLYAAFVVRVSSMPTAISQGNVLAHNCWIPTVFLSLSLPLSLCVCACV